MVKLKNTVIILVLYLILFSIYLGVNYFYRLDNVYIIDGVKYI